MLSGRPPRSKILMYLTMKSLDSPTPTGRLDNLRMVLLRRTGSVPNGSCGRGSGQSDSTRTVHELELGMAPADE